MPRSMCGLSASPKQTRRSSISPWRKSLSPKDREALKGASNGGYHYLGSAKIFAQMGKAFAEALLPLQK